MGFVFCDLHVSFFLLAKALHKEASESGSVGRMLDWRSKGC